MKQRRWGRVVLAAVACGVALVGPVPLASAADAGCVGPVTFGRVPGFAGSDWVNTGELRDRDGTGALHRVTGPGLTVADCENLSVTLQRPNGSQIRVALNEDEPELPPDYQASIRGGFSFPLADGAGTWRVLSVQDGTNPTYRPTNQTFRVLRQQVVTGVLTAPPARQAYATGTLRRYNGSGNLEAAGGRSVVVHAAVRIGSRRLGTAVTDSRGQFRIPVTLRNGDLQAQFAAGGYSVWEGVGIGPDPFDRRQETFLDGRTAPTSTASACAGCQMSSYGHLRLGYRTGVVGAYAHQRVAVQVRPVGASDYTTVTTAGPTSRATGYFLARWPITQAKGTTMDVRLAFLSPYTSVRPAYLYQGRVTVT